jgi:hypothetical protein
LRWRLIEEGGQPERRWSAEEKGGNENDDVTARVWDARGRKETSSRAGMGIKNERRKGDEHMRLTRDGHRREGLAWETGGELG